MQRGIEIHISEQFTPEDLLEMLEIDEAVDHWGRDAFLEEIGKEAAAEYFGLVEEQ